MSRLEPINREDAFTYQFEEDVRVLKCLARQGEADFEKGLQTLEAHISAYRNKNLRKASEKAQKKNAETQAYLKKNFPKLYK